jgi:hypothetical protein
MTGFFPDQPGDASILWSSTLHGTTVPIATSQVAIDAKELLRHHEERGSPIWPKAAPAERREAGPGKANADTTPCDAEATDHYQTSLAYHVLEDKHLANAIPGIMIRRYDSSRQEEDTSLIRALISTDLSEPYGIYVYRYFLFNWPDLTWMVL